MSQHIKVDSENSIKWLYGWDQPLMSFFLQKHDLTEEDEEMNPIIWLGASKSTTMYEVSDLVRAARKHGLDISPEMQSVLYGDKDEGR